MRTKNELKEAIREGGIIDSFVQIVQEPYREQVRKMLINFTKWVLNGD